MMRFVLTRSGRVSSSRVRTRTRINRKRAVRRHDGDVAVCVPSMFAQRIAQYHERSHDRRTSAKNSVPAVSWTRGADSESEHLFHTSVQTQDACEGGRWKAERGGFEPPRQLPVYAISSRVPSAARTPLQKFSVVGARIGRFGRGGRLWQVEGRGGCIFCIRAAGGGRVAVSRFEGLLGGSEFPVGRFIRSWQPFADPPGRYRNIRLLSGGGVKWGVERDFTGEHGAGGLDDWCAQEVSRLRG